MFAKSVDSRWSPGTASVERYRSEDERLELLGGTRVRVNDFAEAVTRFAGNGYLFQERLTPHPEIAAVVAVLLCLLLFKVIRKQRLTGALMSGAGIAQRIVLALALAGLIVLVFAQLGVAILTWGPWLVWIAVAIYLISAIVRAAHAAGPRSRSSDRR